MKTRMFDDGDLVTTTGTLRLMTTMRFSDNEDKTHTQKDSAMMATDRDVG